MHVVMIAVMSQDGYITNGDDPNPSNWSSSEDSEFYKKMLNEYNLYLLGNRTYQLSKYNLPEHAFKIVMAHNVSEQTSTPNTLFTDASFPSILRTFEANYSKMLVLGGSSIYHQMIEQELIDEIFVTIEPVVHGKGVQLATHKNYFEDHGFALSDVKHVNQSGTVIKHYLLKK